MEWRKSFDFPFETALYVAAILLLIGAFYLNSLWLFLFVLFFCLINATTSFYLKHMADYVRFRNPNQKVRLFVDDEEIFFLELENEAKWPLFNGNLSFILDDSSESQGLEKIFSGQTQNTYALPVTLDPQNRMRFTVKIKGMRRGVAKIRGLHLSMRDWFGIGSASLEFDPVILTELVIFPELRAVQGLNHIQTTWQGARYTQYSLDEDLSAPTGTRDYVSSDAFNRIHWKASAKSGDLQTKVFEKTNGMTWVILVNVSRDGQNSADLEREISCVAYICKYAAEHHIPFELYMNVKTRGKPMVHLNAGEGREQLAKALEMLARVHANSLTLPAHWLLSYVEAQHYQNPVMILCHVSYRDDQNGVLSQWKKKGYGQYFVEHNENGSYVMDVDKARVVS